MDSTDTPIETVALLSCICLRLITEPILELYTAYTPCTLGICTAYMVVNMAGPRTAMYVYV